MQGKVEHYFLPVYNVTILLQINLTTIATVTNKKKKKNTAKDRLWSQSDVTLATVT